MLAVSSKKSVIVVLTEAAIVGVGLVLLTHIVKKFDNYLPSIFSIKTTTAKLLEIAFISGMLFHLIFEYTGLNLWYSKEYCKLV
jgi:hypothetical protein